MTLTRILLCLLLFPFVSSAQVAPPTNLSLTCRSQKNILYWDYDQIVPGLRFLVKIFSDSNLKGCRNEIWVDGPPLQANVSFLSDPDATYFLTVKAVLGKNESVSSDGLTFSYFHSSLGGQKCLLDLPPVNVTPQPHHQIQFQFKHPWLVYKEGLSGCKEHKKRVSESKLPNFEYNVKMAGQEQDHTFVCEDAVCEERLRVDAAQDQHCLKIQGSLKKMFVESTMEYCALKTEPPHSHITLYTWISIVILMGAALVAFMVYRRRTSPSSDMPRPLRFGFGDKKKHPPLMPPDDVVSPVESISVSSKEEDDQSFTPSIPGSKEYEVRMKLNPEDPEKGNAADDDTVYMAGGNLASDNEEQESDQESRSPYERRSVVLELAPEDHAEGYRG
ncbi:interferon gamma receptor 1-like [Girardinichthys multiradiatus]|uniref:interferon gamma receptor 1-like n=1 Tax=Girardinichthys multiradiatus TaxID=208333 RepID=UPI001FAE59E4|nr:interferon gamma receptor 1-like [Girardinichthys multiradiatus]